MNKNSRFWRFNGYWGKENPDQKTITKASMIKLEFVPAGSGLLLDVGCGSGNMTKWLHENKGYDVVGMDSSNEAGRSCTANGIDFIRLDAESGIFPFPDGCFDIVTCFEVIEHLKYPGNMLSEIYRVLKRDGKLVISTPNIVWWYLRLKFMFGMWDFQDSDHIRFFTPRLLYECLEDYSFAVEDSVSIFSIPRLASWKMRYLHNMSYDFCFVCEKRV